jgi:hypothetical protein
VRRELLSLSGRDIPAPWVWKRPHGVRGLLRFRAPGCSYPWPEPPPSDSPKQGLHKDARVRRRVGVSACVTRCVCVCVCVCVFWGATASQAAHRPPPKKKRAGPDSAPRAHKNTATATTDHITSVSGTGRCDPRHRRARYPHGREPPPSP